MSATDLLHTFGSASTELAFRAAEQEASSSIKDKMLELEVEGRKKIQGLLQSVNDKMKIGKQAGEALLKQDPTYISKATATMDSLQAENGSKIDEATEENAWAKMEKLASRYVRKKGTTAAMASKAAGWIGQTWSTLRNRGGQEWEESPSSNSTWCRLGQSWANFRNKVNSSGSEQVGSFNLPTLSSLEIPELPSVSLRDLSIPQLSVPDIHLPIMTDLKLSTSYNLPSLSFPRLPPQLDQYLEKGVEKAIEIVVDKGLSKIDEAANRPIEELEKQIESRVKSKAQEIIGQDATEAMEAAKIITHYRTAACRETVNGCFGRVKNTLATGFRAGFRGIANFYVGTSLPLTT